MKNIFITFIVGSMLINVLCNHRYQLFQIDDIMKQMVPNSAAGRAMPANIDIYRR